jgi:hypothetical protein
MRIIDIGSRNVSGGGQDYSSYRNLFSFPNWEYVGCDMAKGDNVDIVLKSPYRWKELKSCSADVVISGQAFEHMEFFWFSIMEIMRILKPGGYCCIIVPSSGFPHRYPVDCWRFYEDGMKALARFAMLEVLEAYTQRNRFDFKKYDETWQDTVLVAVKPLRGIPEKIKDFFRRRACCYLMRDISESQSPVFTSVVAQVFFDHGQGYCARNSLTSVANMNDDLYFAAFDMRLYENKTPVCGIRFDPVAFPAKFVLKEAAAVFKDGCRRTLKISYSNESKKDGEIFVFDHPDANLYFSFKGIPEEMDALFFSGKLFIK